MIREKIKLVVNVNLNYVHYVLINEDDDIQTACFENDKQKGLAIIKFLNLSSHCKLFEKTE